MKNRQLDDNKINQAQVLMTVFKEKYKTRDKAIKSDDLLFGLKATGQVIMSPQTLRELIGYIRHHDLMSPAFILSNVNTGYWLSSDTKEIKGFIDQELNRMSNQFQNIDKVRQRLQDGKDKALKIQTALF